MQVRQYRDEVINFAFECLCELRGTVKYTKKQLKTARFSKHHRYKTRDSRATLCLNHACPQSNC